MAKSKKSKKQSRETISDNISSIRDVIKDAANVPTGVGHAVQEEMSDFMRRATNPLRTEFRPKDLLQVIIGASILAVPVGFTEETWRLGGELPMQNILILSSISIIFIGTFVYYNYYRKNFSKHWGEYAKRVLSTYLFSLGVVAGFLTLIGVAQWDIDLMLSLKRVILVSFPASMSAVVADTIK
jgi:uncharacterized membrane protein